jgi:hypothetical protein
LVLRVIGERFGGAIVVIFASKEGYKQCDELWEPAAAMQLGMQR